MVEEGIHVEDIFKIVSLVPSLIISWTFRFLAHEDVIIIYVRLYNLVDPGKFLKP